MSKLAIDVQNLTKIFDTKIAVDHISLSVKKGAIFGFWEPMAVARPQPYE